MSLFKKIITIILDFKTTRRLLSFRFAGYLVDTGWFNAYTTKSSVGKENQPIPWVTYSFIEFITPRLNKELEMFEYGSGNSTLFYADRVGKVDTVENNRDWYEKVREDMPQNVEMLFRELVPGGDYCRAAKELGRKYDIIIVDGRDRVNCVRNSCPCLKEGGVLVLDDSERDQYKDAFDVMYKEGFRNIGFWGVGVGLFYNKCTTIFYKEKNCLGI